jgi:hypothetical protein
MFSILNTDSHRKSENDIEKKEEIVLTATNDQNRLIGLKHKKIIVANKECLGHLLTKVEIK